MIILIGYMGAGKSTLGKALAHHLQQDFCDLDHYIEQKANKTIADIFATRGENEFRKMEQKSLAELLRQHGTDEPTRHNHISESDC